MTITLKTTELGKILSVEDYQTVMLAVGIGLLVVIAFIVSAVIFKNNKRKRK